MLDTEASLLVGNAAKARDRLGWSYDPPFPALIHGTIEAEVAYRQGRSSAI